MQTTLTIDDQLFAEAANLVAVQNPDLLIEMALTEFIKNHQAKKRDIRELVGKVEIAPDYDYKKLEPIENSWDKWFASMAQFSDDFMTDGRDQPA
jgi:hypothetical protein